MIPLDVPDALFGDGHLGHGGVGVGEHHAVHALRAARVRRRARAHRNQQINPQVAGTGAHLPVELLLPGAEFQHVGQHRHVAPGTAAQVGQRGVRLGLMIPDFVKIQTRAILSAQVKVKKAGGNPIAKIMIPLVGTKNELEMLRERVEAVIASTRKAKKFTGKLDILIGTMIEIPRAALTADQIAEFAEFISFGTNDLTQAVFSFSREDAENKFLPMYTEKEILQDNPFEVLDTKGVGRLMELAVGWGRETRPDMKVGICGEHGGEPRSIDFCHRAGLNYVSCSPFRVPIARLAAAQAAIRNS